jgi:hypothetical protein
MSVINATNTKADTINVIGGSQINNVNGEGAYT